MPEKTEPEAPAADGGPLDNVIWAALTGPQAGFAERAGQAARFQTDVAPFAAMAGGPGRWAWDDLARVVGPGGPAVLFFVEEEPPAGWRSVDVLGLVQMVATDAFADAPEPEARPLGPDDVPAMLDLVGRTRPGPYLQRTIELGSYLGVFDGDALVAMAGERLRIPGMTEVSAVCTDPAYQGHGLATRLMRAVAVGIRARGETPFLHAAATNTTAIRLYEHLGFELRATTVFRFVEAPGLLEPRLLEPGIPEPRADEPGGWADDDEHFVRPGECG
ncbi:GNAT family N-acetyltransferase [Pseudofrankia sp. BMG5.36]|uniref:GNAT family N-acetyltransferase n=1 Tax=Pseudofrankia sp. BMG5.36 TaxID=1834512 RepID=UPI0008DB2724|nr:GNAT family N-acetyltransferase [Pseudofrankia sp. BMG5.36]